MLRKHSPTNCTSPLNNPGVKMAFIIALLLALGSALALTSCGGDDGARVGSPTTAAPTNGDSQEYAEGSVAGILARDGRFTILLSILETAEVREGPPGEQVALGSAAETMGEPGWDHTLFAPVDSAFDALGEDMIASLMSDPDAATEFIRFHVVPRITPSEDLGSGTVTTIGGSVEVSVDDNGIRYGGAEVIQTDIQASNGIIHVIDAVVVP